MSLRHLALAAICAAAFTPGLCRYDCYAPACSEDKNAQALWDQIAKDYEAAHPGVKVEVKYLENEAFKAKLPTMLQADESRPSLFYSWGGGVMDAQAKAGFLKDVSADVAGVEANMAPTAVNAIKVDGKAVGVPFDQGVVSFFYNKKLFEKAGVKAEEIKSWDDFLAAVKTLKAAGITPISVGAGEKWPMHFYYSYLVMRIGGEHALADAKAGKDGGFKSATFVEAGKRLRELAALEPFQPGYLTTKHAESAGIFGDGKAAMELMGEWFIAMQAPFSTSGKGQPEEDIEPVREQIKSAESFVIQGGGLIRLGGSPMWTSKNRRRYDRSRLRYPSDVTDEEWALVEPLIPPAKRGGNRRHVVVREVINGLMYILSTGCQWRAIPTDLPPRSTLYDYFDLWSWDGTLDRIHDALYAQCREAASREASPTAAIIDSQSVKSAEKGGLRLIRRATMRARRSRARSGTSSSIRRAC